MELVLIICLTVLLIVSRLKLNEVKRVVHLLLLLGHLPYLSAFLLSRHIPTNRVEIFVVINF